jgi:hypothetical protein
VRVLVAAALASRQEVVELDMAEGSTVAEAIALARIAERFPELSGAEPGIWGRVVPGTETLREADRVELYRPVSADAKQMRRARAALNPSRRSRSGP